MLFSQPQRRATPIRSNLANQNQQLASINKIQNKNGRKRAQEARRGKAWFLNLIWLHLYSSIEKNLGFLKNSTTRSILIMSKRFNNFTIISNDVFQTNSSNRACQGKLYTFVDLTTRTLIWLVREFLNWKKTNHLLDTHVDTIQNSIIAVLANLQKYFFLQNSGDSNVSPNSEHQNPN